MTTFWNPRNTRNPAQYSNIQSLSRITLTDSPWRVKNLADTPSIETIWFSGLWASVKPRWLRRTKWTTLNSQVGASTSRQFKFKTSINRQSLVTIQAAGRTKVYHRVRVKSTSTSTSNVWPLNRRTLLSKDQLGHKSCARLSPACSLKHLLPARAFTNSFISTSGYMRESA